MFENLIWQKDRLLYNGLVFRLQHYKSDDWELGEDCFIFYKIKKLVDQYSHFFATRDFQCERLFELGMWEGGSVAFWYEGLSTCQNCRHRLGKAHGRPVFPTIYRKRSDVTW
jgi:hypothetical protein